MAELAVRSERALAGSVARASASVMHRLKFLVPNAFTAASMLLGLGSVIQSAAGSFELAAWMILWGVLLDKLDGTSARLLGASSRIGAELDSFSDFVAFGVAPAALLYFKLGAPDRSAEVSAVLVACAAGAYVVATATRLARFNITTPPMGDRIFYGVPTTMCGAIVASAFLTSAKFGLDPAVLRHAPWLLVVLGLLMVSTLKLPKLKRRKSALLNAVQYANVAAGGLACVLRQMPEYLLGLAALYTVGGLALYLVRPPRPDSDATASAPAVPA